MMGDINDIGEQFRELLLKSGIDPSTIEKQLPPHFLAHELEHEYGIVHCPSIEDNESDTDYFMRLMEWSDKAKEVPQIHERWKRRHMNGLRVIDCRQRIIIVLEELLKSDFLRPDWFDTDIPKEDLEIAEKEIYEQGLEKVLEIEGACWKFALLNEFRKPDIERIVIIEKHAGQYIREMHDRLSSWSVDVFCRFVTFIRLVYEEIDHLKSFEKQQSVSSEDTGLGDVRQSKLDEIIDILQKGDWKQPATADNIKLLLNTVFGKDVSLLEKGDEAQCEKMWSLVEGGGGDRMVIVPANLAGFLKEENLLKGSPKEISNALFSNGNQVNNINKGNSNRCSVAFRVVIPFIKKYIDKIIRQV